MKEDNIKWDHPEEMESKGSILLVHGTAAMNLKGNIPGISLEQYPLGAMSLYEKLSKVLTAQGWSTLRYTRSGVYKDRIDWDEYMKVDHKAITDQLNRIFNKMPSNKPRIILCWSGGSLHVPHISLDEVEGVVIIGGLSTKRFHNALMMSKSLEEYKKYIEELQVIENMSYEEILKINKPNGLDGPFIRFWQESKLNDNWTYFKKYVDLPMLILHGSKDPEVSVEQAYLWKQLLPYHNITLVEKPKGNHFLGNDKENGVEVVGSEVLKWLNGIFS